MLADDVLMNERAQPLWRRAEMGAINDWTIRPRRSVLVQIWPLLLFGPIATAFLSLIAHTFLVRDAAAGLEGMVGALSVVLAAATIGMALWPVIFVMAAKLVVREDRVDKVYPFGVWRRSLLRSDFGGTDAYQMDVGSAVHRDTWRVVRFRDKRGRVKFKVGTNWWPPDQLNALISHLG